MKVKRSINKVLFQIMILFIVSTVSAQEATKPKYSADVPKSLLTPDKVETELLGTLEFSDGRPRETTTKKVYDFLDLSRGVESFLNGIPALSIHAVMEGLKDVGLKPGDMGIFEELLDARTLFLTANTTTPYMFAEIDLKDGPVVVEVGSPVLGFVDDAFFRFVTDIGLTGPDKGKGGKYLFVGPDYEGDIPEGYFVAKSVTYRHWLFLRAFVKDGDLKAAISEFKEGFRCYPLAQAEDPPEQRFLDLSGKQFNTIQASDAHCYEELNEVIQYEPADAFNAELVGLFASIGIKKGQPFAPDARMKKILEDAAAIGNASVRAMVFSPRKEGHFIYPDRYWSPAFRAGHEFMDKGEMVLNDRSVFHYGATGITPAMAVAKVGTGSGYAAANHDSEGRYLDGGKTYTVTLPAPVPANDFWALTVYSTQHRSMLETDQKTAGVDSNSPGIEANGDGSYTVWFGPKAPEGHEGNWIQTISGKGYFVLIRLYGPLQPWFDETWKPGDFELVK